MIDQSSRIRVECADRVATLRFGEAALSRRLLRELDQALRSLERSRAADVLILRAAGPDRFPSGPDLDEYQSLIDDESRRRFAYLGQSVFDRLEQLSTVMPTIAFIEGECTNAGLELALACDFRLAVARPETRLGFNALGNGLMPCWGATQRLPRLIGYRRAEVMLVGNRILTARAAKSIGLVDHAFGPKPAKTELNWFVADVQDRGRRANRQHGRRGWRLRLREHPGWFRPGPAAPNPMARILGDTMTHGWRFGIEEGLTAERAAFAADGHHPAGEELRRLARRRQEQAAIWEHVPVPKRIGIYGGENRAIELAVIALHAGEAVALFDANADLRGAIAQRMKQALRQAVTDGRFTMLEAEQKFKAFRITSCFDSYDLVLLTGPDSAQVEALIELDRRLPAEVGLVVTSPTINLGPLARGLRHGSRLLGAHFPSGESVIAPIELVATRLTAERQLARLFRWLAHAGFTANTPETDISRTAAA